MRTHITTPSLVSRWCGELQLKWYCFSICAGSVWSRQLARTAMIPARFFSWRDRDRAAQRWAARAARLDESWAEPWVAMGALWMALDRPEVAFEALMGASARDPYSRVVILMLAGVLDDLGMHEEAYHWHRRAAHAAWDHPDLSRDGHSDGMFWRELGLFCLEHERDEEARDVAAFATLYDGWSGGRRA